MSCITIHFNKYHIYQLKFLFAFFSFLLVVFFTTSFLFEGFLSDHLAFLLSGLSLSGLSRSPDLSCFSLATSTATFLSLNFALLSTSIRKSACSSPASKKGECLHKINFPQRNFFTRSVPVHQFNELLGIKTICFSKINK